MNHVYQCSISLFGKKIKFLLPNSLKFVHSNLLLMSDDKISIVWKRQETCRALISSLKNIMFPLCFLLLYYRK